MSVEISYTKNSVAEYAVQISSAWHKATESIIAVGRLLIDAEHNLGPAGFKELKRGLEDNRVISRATITKLKAIAHNRLLTNPDHIPLLPVSYETLYNLARWDDDKLLGAFRDGTITPALKQKESREMSLSDATISQPPNTVLFQVEYSRGDLRPRARAELKAIVERLEAMDGISVTKKNHV